MTRFATLLSVLATTLALMPFALPAQATGTLTRTFVSSTGSDNNACTIAAPCATFAAAYAAVVNDGIVAALDPGKYGPLNITGPVTINGNGWAAITGPASGNAIAVNAAAGSVVLIGLEIDGAKAATTGILFNSGDSLTVRDCVIRDFAGNGINVVPNTPNPTRISIASTQASDNGAHGININPAGAGTTNGIISNIEADNNAVSGVLVAASNTQIVNVTVNAAVTANNTVNGITAESPTGTTVGVMVRDSIIANNAEIGLQGSGVNSVLRVTRSTVTGNGEGWAGNVVSYADNNIDGNGTTNSEPPNPLSYH